MIKRIKLRKGQTISQSELYHLCASARNTYDYIRITMYNNKYVQVNFHRDQTLSVAHNMTDLTMYFATNNMMNRNKIYSTQNVVEYLARIIQRYN